MHCAGQHLWLLLPVGHLLLIVCLLAWHAAARLAESGGVCTFCGSQVALRYADGSAVQPQAAAPAGAAGPSGVGQGQPSAAAGGAAAASAAPSSGAGPGAAAGAAPAKALSEAEAAALELKNRLVGPLSGSCWQPALPSTGHFCSCMRVLNNLLH